MKGEPNRQDVARREKRTIYRREDKYNVCNMALHATSPNHAGNWLDNPLWQNLLP